MDKGFFRTKYFLIAGAFAIAIVSAAVSVYAVTGGPLLHLRDACSSPTIEGTSLSVVPETTPERNGRELRSVYKIEASSYQGGRLELCLGVGEIIVEPTDATTAELVVTIRADSAEAARDTIVHVAFTSRAERLHVYAWETQIGGTARRIIGTDSADVTMVLKVPDSGAYDLQASNDVGDVRVSRLILSTLRAHTDVGSVHATEIDLGGDASLHTDVGNVLLEALSVATGKITLRSDVGDAEALLPERVDVGYDARGKTDVGEVEIRLGSVEDYRTDGDGPGEDERARSSGFATKPTRVVVDAHTDVGDIRIIASPEAA